MSLPYALNAGNRPATIAVSLYEKAWIFPNPGFFIKKCRLALQTLFLLK
jgi:hypothetical protein